MKSTLLVAASIVSLLALVAPASAEPGHVTPSPVQLRKVDEDVAVGLALGGTVASWGVLVVGTQIDSDGLTWAGAVGTMFGPGLGHWYSGKVFSRGLGLRALGLGVATAAFVMMADFTWNPEGEETSQGQEDDDDTANTLLLIGAGLYVAGTVDDIATAGSAARKYNARFENVTLVPTANKHGGGFALVGRF
jgi:hypothetical protein